MRAYTKFYITPKGERAARSGHPWVYAEEITRTEGEYQNGDLVDVVTGKGKYLGTGFVNDHSKIRVRLISTNTNDKFDADFWERRLRYAIDYRRTVMPGADFKCCRLIFGEADHFPGLTVDRFNDILVAQTLSLGIEVRKELIFNLLYKILREQGEEIRGLYERNDVKIRLLEGMEENKGWFTLAEAPEPYNRQAIAKIARGKHVLDCFTHTGAFALNAAAGGAASVTAVDISAEAVQMTDANASKNGLDKVVKGLKANVFDLLSELFNNKSREYDFIILDPPAFTKSGSTVKNAIRGYKEINLKAMKLLPRGGYLATCSCSHFMKEELFVQMLHDAAADANVQLRQIEARQQSPDHPILWNVPETYYLKFYIFQVV